MRYDVVDLEAADVPDALRRLAERFPPAASESCDLLELRRRVDPETREFVPE